MRIFTRFARRGNPSLSAHPLILDGNWWVLSKLHKSGEVGDLLEVGIIVQTLHVSETIFERAPEVAGRFVWPRHRSESLGEKIIEFCVCTPGLNCRRTSRVLAEDIRIEPK